MKVDNVTREEQIVGGLALLLLLDLLILPWFSPTGISLTGTDSPDSLLGLLSVIALLLLIADLAVERFSPQIQVPALGGSRAATRFVLAAAAAGFMALKFLLQLSHFSDLGFGFWLGALLAGALVYFAMQARSGSVSFPTRPRSGTTPRGGTPA